MIPHALKGRVRWRTGIVFGLAGMVGAFSAGRVAHFIPAGILLVSFGAMMLVTAVAMLRGRKVPSPSSDPKAHKDLPVLKVLAEGLVVGAVTGLVGAGGGFLVVPALVLLGGLSMEVAVGTSLVVIAMKSFAGFAGFLGHTEIDWTIGLTVAASAVVGSVLGAWLAGRVAPNKLRVGFAWFVVVMAFFILGQEVPRALGSPLGLGAVLLVTLAGTSTAVALWALVSKLARARETAGETRSTTFRDAPGEG
jgi:uncharacterized membrane protein YfcA